MDRMSEILEGLINKTEEGKLTWQTGVQRDSFMTSLGDIGIIIREESLGQYELTILNDTGRVALELRTPSQLALALEDSASTPTEKNVTWEHAGEISLLFALVKGSALKTDSTLDQLAKSLAEF